MEILQKLKVEIAFDIATPLGIALKYLKTLFHNVYVGTIHNSNYANSLGIHGMMNECRRCYTQSQRRIQSFEGKWMYFEIMMLNELNQKLNIARFLLYESPTI